jgi:hypothetical protein
LRYRRDWQRQLALQEGEIYFIPDAGGRFAISRRDASTGKSEKVVESSTDEWGPALSPDER